MNLSDEFFHVEAFLALLSRFALNIVITGIIIYFLYYKKTQRRDFLFTFFMVSTTIFLMIFLLESIKLQVGFALGLFAIFGILRYRTDTLPVREMTYLFAIIGISVINALSNERITVTELLMTNLLFVLMFWLLETTLFIRHYSTKLVIYEKIGLIRPSCYQEMIEDLRDRTGLDIRRFEVGQVDFLKDIAFVKIYYLSEGGVNTADSIGKTSEFIGE
ncbi:MAG: DUF4956 domain-containing protein [Dysgonamonadaceae bacterium]